MSSNEPISYKKIVLGGYFSNPNHLSNHIYRHFKTAQSQHYSPNEFFEGCTHISDSLLADLEGKMLNRRAVLEDMLSNTKLGQFNPENIPNGQTPEEYKTSTINYCEKELENLSLNSFEIGVEPNELYPSPYPLKPTDINTINKAIAEAQYRVDCELSPHKPATATNSPTYKQPLPPADYQITLGSNHKEIIDALSEPFDLFVNNYRKQLSWFLEKNTNRKEIHFINANYNCWMSALRQLESIDPDDISQESLSEEDTAYPFLKAVIDYGHITIIENTSQKCVFLSEKAYYLNPLRNSMLPITNKDKWPIADFDRISQSAADYTKSFFTRSQAFLSHFEADETDFIEKELEYWTNILLDIENPVAATDGFGRSNLIGAIEKATIIYGWEKIFYGTKSKISFLNKISSNPKEFNISQQDLQSPTTENSSNANNSAPTNNPNYPEYHLIYKIGKDNWEIISAYITQLKSKNSALQKPINKTQIAKLVYIDLYNHNYLMTKPPIKEAVKIIRDTFGIYLSESTVRDCNGKTESNPLPQPKK